MPLSSLFQRFRRGTSPRQAAVSDAVPLSQSDVEAERVRARRRLIGMVVLVGAGVIGFPWLFETQPRPMSSDIQLLQAPSPAGAGSVGSSVPSLASSRSAAGKVAVAGIVEAPPVPEPDVAEPAPKSVTASPRENVEDADKPAAPVRPAVPVKPPVVAKPLVKEPVKAPTKDADKPAATKDSAKPAAKVADKASDKPATRYVVQFGAFADVNTAHEARMKVERLGIKTYAQQVDTPAGKRIRVRVGPYTDKAEADKAMATVRKAGLAGAVLTL